jgi:hypothetical protein
MHGFSSFEWPAVQIWIFRRNSNKRTKSTSYWKHCYNCPKMVYVGLYSVGTYHKKFGGQNKKIKIWFVECPQKTLGKDPLCQVPYIWHLAKNLLCRVPTFDPRQRLTAVRFRRPRRPFAERHLCWVFASRQSSICRVFLCAECPALGKQAIYRAQDFAECNSRQSLLCRVLDKKHSAKRLALGKGPDSGSAYTPCFGV